MKRKELIAIIEKGENINCEFKRKFSTYEKIAKEMIAFANTSGGLILFGVDDNKEIVGVDSEKAEVELISETAENYCVPPLEYEVEFIDVNGKEVVIIDIAESNNKPHRLQDYLNNFDITKAMVFIRVNDKSIQASKEMIRIMRAESDNLKLKKYSIGDIEKNAFEYLGKNETITVKDLSELVNISTRRASRALVKMVRAKLLMIHTKENGEEYFTSRS
jgi:predicted HTH transcriptional regulator